jgi:HD superfamily phosphohydrolase
MKAKRINCPIHDTMRFSPKAIAIIDTPHFQRLRELRQLGLTSFIFPTANHTRFEHSLGVYHLAEMWSRRLQQQTCRDSYRITEEDVECISLAGLCHDLGHGPFSHAFDHELLRRLDITTFVHEEMSCKILRDIVDTVGEVNGEPLLTEDQVRGEEKLGGRRAAVPV